MTAHRIDVIRMERAAEHIVGILRADGVLIGATIERVGMEIQAGMYDAYKRVSPRYERLLWTLKSVPGRTDILIHQGNYATDSTGCIIVGEGIGVLKSRRAVKSSVAALNTLMAATTRWTGGIVIVQELY
jgi:hypothetical protein